MRFGSILAWRPTLDMRPVRPTGRRALAGIGTMAITLLLGTAAVAVLESRGIADASPFSYFTDAAADLNICSEPPEFLPPEERRAFEPLDFFGSFWPGEDRPPPPAEPFGAGAADKLRVYAGLGTAALMMCPAEAMALLSVVAEAIAADPSVSGLISLGSRQVAAADRARLERPNVRVEPYVDQVAVLRAASVFITHNGLNSTHEAIVHGVPMISCPLFGDQPALAARCRELGLAIPLAPAAGTLPIAAGGLPTAADVRRALDRVRAEEAALRARLAEAQGWEHAVMERRPAVLRRVAALMG